MLVGILEFVVILILRILLTLIVMLQDYCLTKIKATYSKTIIAMIIVSIRMFSSAWIIFVTEPTLMGAIQAVAIQSIILLFLLILSKYVQTYKESWYITIVAFIAYGISSYFYFMFAFIA
ncbi:hypothetical protein M3215_05130 [Bacillus cytotoxicus]|uniref:Uncharacterized protein n=1 Tax=Bacillus cytotoxicus TaxID=580165 RepID=A0ACC6A4D2_9BACI|nr:hypothetical protein [Bacillus cytotoxicus]